MGSEVTSDDPVTYKVLCTDRKHYLLTIVSYQGECDKLYVI